MTNLNGLKPHEIYDLTIDTVRKQFRYVVAYFFAGNKMSLQQEVEKMLSQAKVDLVKSDNLLLELNLFCHVNCRIADLQMRPHEIRNTLHGVGGYCTNECAAREIGIHDDELEAIAAQELFHLAICVFRYMVDTIELYWFAQNDAAQVHCAISARR